MFLFFVFRAASQDYRFNCGRTQSDTLKLNYEVNGYTCYIVYNDNSMEKQRRYENEVYDPNVEVDTMYLFNIKYNDDFSIKCVEYQEYIYCCGSPKPSLFSTKTLRTFDYINKIKYIERFDRQPKDITKASKN